MAERTISECQHKLLSNNCKKCGICWHPQDPAIKTTRFDSFLNCSAPKYLKHMRLRQCPVLESRQIAQSTSALLQAICDKFEYTIQTLALGLYIFTKACDKQKKDEKFWASACLMVASKGIQLDKRVPYLNRYQRYADKSFSQEDYELAEKTVFQEMGFDVQFTTFISFIHFYLTNGIVFGSDGLPSNTVKHVEDEVLYKAKEMIRNGSFTSYEPEKLALALIKQTRVKYRLDPWKKQLESISGYSGQSITTPQKSNALKPLNLLSSTVKARDKPSSVCLSNSTNLSVQNTTIDTKNKISRKRMENTLKLLNVKQNSTRVLQGNLNSHRNSTFSTSKHHQSVSICTSNDRILPLSSFISRRL